MAEDFLGLDIDSDDERKPALIAGAATTADAVELMERQHRHGGAQFPGATEVIFTIDDGDGERLEDGQAERWQKIMQWPRLPTLEEVIAFKAHAAARLRARFWPDFAALERQIGCKVPGST